MEKTVSEAISHRRSVRRFDPEYELDSEKVKKCIQNAVLAPTSSNLQLWEFYHVTDTVVLQRMGKACLGQNAAVTAKQLVVVATRKDLWRQRARANVRFLKDTLGDKPASAYDRREKFAFAYYQKVIPSVYFDFFGIVGLLRYFVFQIVGLFRPIYRQVRHSDMRVVAHKSAGLAAQNFMTSMAAIGYDTCPMEGSDTRRVKQILGLPWGAEINMVIACGIRADDGVYGPRFRVPFEQVYREV